MKNVFDIAENYIKNESILECLMYIGEKNFKDLKIQLYKHINTRKYINIDKEGNFYEYDRNNNSYVIIAKEKSILNLLS